MSAASFKAMGVSEFAARLPHWLGACAIAWSGDGLPDGHGGGGHCARVGHRFRGPVPAAGAVMTDIALGLGTTMAMRGFWLGLQGDPAGRLREQALFFAGLAIGLLAKGPIAAVLVGLPLAVWTPCDSASSGPVAREFRWVGGMLLTTMLVVPCMFLLNDVRPVSSSTSWSVNTGTVSSPPTMARRSVRECPCLPAGVDLAVCDRRLSAVVRLAPCCFAPVAAHGDTGTRRGPTAAALPPALGARSLRVLQPWPGTSCGPTTPPVLPALAMLLALRLARVPQRAQVNQLYSAGGVAVMVLGIGAAVVAINVGSWGEKGSTRDLFWPTTTLIARTGRHWSSCDTGPPLQPSTAGAGPRRSAARTSCSRA